MGKTNSPYLRVSRRPGYRRYEIVGTPKSSKLVRARMSLDNDVTRAERIETLDQFLVNHIPAFARARQSRANKPGTGESNGS